MAQLDLFDADAPPRRPRTIQERFRRFHELHPDVYELFKRFAFEMRNAGRRHYGSKGIFERVRWHYATSSQGAGDFKLDNNFSSRYARLLVAEHPEFEGFFEMRRLRAE